MNPRNLLRLVLCGAVLAVAPIGSVALAQTTPAPSAAQTHIVQSTSILAQTDDDSGSSTRIRGRSMRGIVKLVIWVVVGLIALGGFVIRKMGGR